jgi:hypothetical protein
MEEKNQEGNDPGTSSSNGFELAGHLGQFPIARVLIEKLSTRGPKNFSVYSHRMWV